MAPRFQHSVRKQNGETLHLLTEPDSGAEATIWPAFGNNCMSLSLPTRDGRVVRIIDDLKYLCEARQQPSRFGTPVLFPWCGRIPGGRYAFGGKQHQVTDLDAKGGAIHGFVKTRAWTVVSETAGDTSATLRCTISSEDYPETLESYPFPYQLIMETALGEQGMTMRMEVVNQGESPMPFGFGLHPYFTLPFGANGSRAGCVMHADAERQWVWSEIAKVQPVMGSIDFGVLSTPPRLANKHRLGDANYDDGLTGLADSGGCVQAMLEDPAAGITLVVESDPDFRTLLFFTPAQRQAACLEPWTCTVNAFNLAEAGYGDSGLIVLQPGQAWAGSVRIFIREA